MLAYLRFSRSALTALQNVQIVDVHDDDVKLTEGICGFRTLGSILDVVDRGK